MPERSNHRSAFAVAGGFLFALLAVSPIEGGVTKVGTPIAISSCPLCTGREPSIAGGKTLAMIGWEGETATEDNAALGRFFLTAGKAKGPNVSLHPATQFLTEEQTQVAFGGIPGSFVAVWRQETTSTNGDLFMRRYSIAGAPLGNALPVSVDDPASPTSESLPAVSVGADGSILIAWISRPVPGLAPPANPAVMLRRFDAAGNPLGGAIVANTSLVAGERPAVCHDSANVGVVAFSTADRISPFTRSKLGAVVRRFAAIGTPIGAEVVLAKPLASDSAIDVSCSPLGGSVVAWSFDIAPALGDGDILWQRFDKTGKKVGKIALAHVNRAGKQHRPALRHDAKGNWVIAWQSQGDLGTQVAARRFLANGKPDGNEWVVASSAEPGDLVGYPDLAFYGTKGEFAIAWEENRRLLRLQRFLAK